MPSYSPSLFPNLDPLSPESVLELVTPVVPLVRGVVQQVFEDLLSRRQEDNSFTRMNEGECAWWMWTQIRHEAQDMFSDGSDISYCETRQQTYLNVSNRIALVYKKLKRGDWSELRRSNYRTTQNTDYWGQRQVEGFPDLPRAIFGYELVSELTEIRYFVGLPSAGSSELRWACSIENELIPLSTVASDTSELIEETPPPFEIFSDEEFSSGLGG